MSLSLALLSLAAPLAKGETTHHGLVFDAGSSGTRIHVYTWKTGGGGAKASFDLVSDNLLKKKPGLSAFKDNPSEAGASLRPLLEYARKYVPAELAATTPAFLMATAGLRMVGEKAKDAILASVCDELKASGFLFRCEWATLLDGQDEGLYGWVTVNYLIDTLYPPATAQSVGIIDLGGGSVQIVFESPGAINAPSGYAQQLDFGGRKHDTYIKSHLGFGLDAARTALLDFLASHHTAKGKDAAHPSHHPCLPTGSSLTHKGIEFQGTGDWSRCLKVTARLFDMTKCAHTSCSFGGAFQPPLPPTFYGFSYMYDRTTAIGLLDETPRQYGSQEMSRTDIESKGAALCTLTKEQAAARFATHQDASKSSNFCGDVAYVAALLSSLGFEPTTKLTMTNKIKDVELVWTLGAMLAKSAELSSGKGTSASGGVTGGFMLKVALGLAAAVFCVTRILPSERGRGYPP